MILRNHGFLTCGKTISEAFMLMYYLDRACKNQIDTLSMQKKQLFLQIILWNLLQDNMKIQDFN